MLRRSEHRQAGITLIELLVVIAIIAVLMSLLVSAVMRTMVVSPRTETTARMTALNHAVNTFKNHESFGRVNYIPPGRFEPGPNPPRGWYAFRLRNTYPPAGTAQPGEPDDMSFEAQYLQKVFGGGRGLNFGDLGYRNASNQPILRADLDANQTLIFFLTGIPEVVGNDALFTGFSAHPQQPFTRRASTSETRRGEGPMLDMGGRRKYEIDANGFARIIDGFGNPYLYFAAREGKTNLDYGGYNPLAPSVLPYSRNGQFENAQGFQLISAGKDGVFGQNGDWTRVSPGGEDDQSNFSSALLGSGP